MKRVILFTIILNSLVASGQDRATLENTSIINVATDEVNKVYFAPENTGNLKSGSKGCDIVVTYSNFSEEAKIAFEYAISIWEANITTNVPVNIHVSMDKLADHVLGQGKPAIFLRNFRSTPIADVYYPVALAEKITDKEQNKANEADITCNFNSNKAWYFGTDGNTPVNSYDFVSAVLHEIGHGLGFAGFFTSENGIARLCNTSGSPSIYDYYVMNKYNQRIADNSLFPCPSTELTKQLTSNSLLINYDDYQNVSGSATVYSPSTWTTGVSLYHLKNDLSNGTASELMAAYAYRGEAKHNLGNNTLQVLAELGWGLKSTETNNVTTAVHRDAITGSTVSMYPNPCRGKLNIQLPVTMTDSPCTIEVFSLTGKSVHKEIWGNQDLNTENSIDLTSLESGVYLVQATSDKSEKFINKIIKN